MPQVFSELRGIDALHLNGRNGTREFRLQAGMKANPVVLQQALAGTGVDPAVGIALVLGVDRILDMCRTALNVTGDLTAAAVIARSEGELNMPDLEAA